MAARDALLRDMLVLIRWQSRTMAVPLSQLAALNVDESTAEGIADWHGLPKATASDLRIPAD